MDDEDPLSVRIAYPTANAHSSGRNDGSLASDDVGVATLDWFYSERQFGCPDSRFVDCVVEDNAYRWTLRVGEGTRTFRAIATDMLGNVSETDWLTITLLDDAGPGPVDDAYENNNTPEWAIDVGCDMTLDLVSNPGDADWFTFEAPAGKEVVVSTSAGVNASVLSSGVAPMAIGEAPTRPATLMVARSSCLRVDEAVDIYIANEDGEADDYTLIECRDLPTPDSNDDSEDTTDDGCAQSAPTWPSLLLFSLFLVRRRRRAITSSLTIGS